MPRKRIKPTTKIEKPLEALTEAIEDTVSVKGTSYNITMIQQACYDLVGQKELDKLEEILKDILTKHFKEWHDQLKKLDKDPLLNKLSDQYENYKNISSLIPTFYSSYNQHYNSDNKTLDIIKKFFIQEVLSDEQLFKQTTTSILEVIDSAQKGSGIDLGNAKNIIQMYYSFRSENDKPEIFENFFDKLREQEVSYCDDFYNNNFKTSSFTTYLENAQKQFIIINNILNEKQLLKEKEAKEILTDFNYSLLSSRENDFLEGETPLISRALTAKDPHPIKYLIDTYENLESDIKPLYEACAQYIKNEMLKKAQDFPQDEEKGKDKGEDKDKGKDKEKDKDKGKDKGEDKDKDKGEDKDKDKGKDKDKEKKGKKESDILTLVGSLIELTLNLIEQYKKVFDYNKPTLEELNKCIIEAWNDERFNMTENFSDYIDALVTSKFKSYESNNNVSNNGESKSYAEKLKTEIIPQFYQYLANKKEFENYYEASFVRRLIKMRSTIEEYDYPIINSIQKHNRSFMEKLDKFKEALENSDQLRDEFKEALKNSDQLRDEFKEALENSDQLRDEFKEALKNSDQLRDAYSKIEPFVFKLNVYPLPKDKFDCIPASAVEINKLNKEFKEFYHSKHQKESLDLIQQGSLVEFGLKGRLHNYTLVMDLPCACIYSALSSKPHTYSEIKQLFGTDENKKKLAKIACHILFNKKVIILKEKQTISKLKDDHVLMINFSFNSKKAKVTIPPTKTKWKQQVKEQSNIDKFNTITCTINRILKGATEKMMEYKIMETKVIGILREKYKVEAKEVMSATQQILEVGSIRFGPDNSKIYSKIIDDKTYLIYG